MTSRGMKRLKLRSLIFSMWSGMETSTDRNGDGVLSFVEADVTAMSDGLPNTRLYLPATAFNRFAITREPQPSRFRSLHKHGRSDSALTP